MTKKEIRVALLRRQIEGQRNLVESLKSSFGNDRGSISFDIHQLHEMERLLKDIEQEVDDGQEMTRQPRHCGECLFAQEGQCSLRDFKANTSLASIPNHCFINNVKLFEERQDFVEWLENYHRWKI